MGYDDCLKVLLADPNLDVATCVSREYKLFLGQNVPQYEAGGRSPLLLAIEEGREEAVKMLLEHDEGRQLLALVVRKERPDLAAMKSDLVQQQNMFKITIKKLEDDIHTFQNVGSSRFELLLAIEIGAVPLVPHPLQRLLDLELLARAIGDGLDRVKAIKRVQIHIIGQRELRACGILSRLAKVGS